jgi:hypothetical protein
MWAYRPSRANPSRPRNGQCGAASTAAPQGAPVRGALVSSNRSRSLGSSAVNVAAPHWLALLCLRLPQSIRLGGALARPRPGHWSAPEFKTVGTTRTKRRPGECRGADAGRAARPGARGRRRSVASKMPAERRRLPLPCRARKTLRTHEQTAQALGAQYWRSDTGCAAPGIEPLGGKASIDRVQRRQGGPKTPAVMLLTSPQGFAGSCAPSPSQCREMAGAAGPSNKARLRPCRRAILLVRGVAHMASSSRGSNAAHLGARCDGAGASPHIDWTQRAHKPRSSKTRRRTGPDTPGAALAWGG